jgi:lipid A oxidase
MLEMRILFTVFLLLWPVCSYAEFSVAFYGGLSDSRDSEVQLTEPNDTALTFQEVSWDDRSFENPIYWGVRFNYWPQSSSHWGLALDFTHAKIHAELDKTTTVTGTRQGNPVNGSERLDITFSELAMSHGHNLLTINGLYRWFPGQQRAASWLARLHPYAGFGAGVAIPHVEVNTGDSVTNEYQIGGPVLNGMAGLEYKLGRGFSIFGEYKLSVADLDVDLTSGGTLKTQVWTNHLNLGLAYGF